MSEKGKRGNLLEQRQELECCDRKRLVKKAGKVDVNKKTKIKGSERL